MLKKIKEKYSLHKLKKAQKKEARKNLVHQIKNTPSAFDKSVMSWISPEYLVHERGVVWKIVMTVITLSIIGVTFYYGNWSLALAIAVFALVYCLVHLQHQEHVEVKISEIGIKIGFRKYSYSHIKGFWLVYQPPYVSTLNIKVEGSLVGEITIQLGDEDPAAIREYLINKIPEYEGKSESLTDSLARLFKI